MAARRTWGDLKRGREHDLFVGRKAELDQFQQNLARADDPEYVLFNIHGQAGMGKTWLLRRYQAKAKVSGFLIATTNERERSALKNASIVATMAKLSQDLAATSFRLETFEKQHERYCQCMQQIESDETAPTGLTGMLTRAALRVGVGALKQQPLGMAVDISLREFDVDTDGWIDQAGEWGNYLAKKFGNKSDEVALVKDPVATLTPIFFKDLNGITEAKRVLLCFDTWEVTGNHLQDWLLGVLEQETLSAGVWLAIAGREPLDAKWEHYHGMMAFAKLDVFEPVEAEQYLTARQITDETRRSEILEFSRRVPILMEMLASATGGSTQDVADSLVDRYLSWVDDPAQKQAAQWCAIPHWFNEDIVKVVLEATNSGDDITNPGEVFTWLSRMPFVQHNDAWSYHPLVREQMMAYACARSEQCAEDLHSALADYHWKRIGGREAKPRYSDGNWRKHRLEALYHNLQQPGNQGIVSAADAFLLAGRREPAFAGAVALTCRQSAEQADHRRDLADFAQLMDDAWRAWQDNTWEPWLRLRETLPIEGLANEARYELYRICGLAALLLDRLQQALSDLSSAIALDSENAYLHQLRGVTYAKQGAYDLALADYARAIELDPDYATAYSNRGNTYCRQGAYDLALADYARAIELNPDYATAYYNRGNTYAKQGAYDEALADYARAIELDPDYATAYSNRGNIYDELAQYDEALADYARAVELDPDHATAYSNRGNTYAELERYDLALADYARAIELNPQDATAYINRSATYAKQGEYAAAMADCDHAIELDPQYAHAFYNKACTYGLQGDAAPACEWLAQAIGLDESFPADARKDSDLDKVRDAACMRALLGDRDKDS